MQNHLLLLEDVENLARKGDVVKVKPGYARNFLLPRRKAVVVDKRTLRLQEQLKVERAKQAVADRKAALALGAALKDKAFEVKVKVDPDGHMYGSVSANDIIALLGNEGFEVNKKSVKLAHQIKKLGVHEITLHLSEGVDVQFALKVTSDSPIRKLSQQVEKPTEEKAVEADSEEAKTDEVAE
ncbi:MAG: 50S ribosomal protein L9 [Rhabdochlamydiaceae bacterium]|nr:50S ribosomal protein L9 [Candidatus Amphrikana amoebophyrae]